MCPISSSRTFGVQGENPMKSNDESRLILLQLGRDWVSTQGNRDELKIFLQIFLITSRINQELRRTRENTSGFKGRFPPSDLHRLLRWVHVSSSDVPKSRGIVTVRWSHVSSLMPRWWWWIPVVDEATCHKRPSITSLKYPFRPRMWLIDSVDSASTRWTHRDHIQRPLCGHVTWKG